VPVKSEDTRLLLTLRQNKRNAIRKTDVLIGVFGKKLEGVDVIFSLQGVLYVDRFNISH
jgi:hypothetical protein